MAFKELKPEDWFVEIEKGLEFRRDYGLEEIWTQNESFFYNVNPHSSYGPNLIMSVGDAMISHLSSSQPRVSVSATRATGHEAARIIESVDNQLIDELNVDLEIQEAVLHAYLYGRGFLKIGYDSEWGWSPELGIHVNDEALGVSLSQFDSKGRRIEFDDSARPGMPWVKAVLPHDIVLPWGTKSLKDARWIAHRVIRGIDEIKADPKYTNRRDLEPMMSMKDFTESYLSVHKLSRLSESGGFSALNRLNEGNEAKFCELWEIHDKVTGKVVTLASGFDKFLRNESDSLQLGSLPFCSISFIPVARAFWTTPDAYYLSHYQNELFDISIQASKQRKASVLKFLFSDGAISEEQLENILSTDVGLGVKIEAGNSLKEAVQPFTASNNNQFLYQDSYHIRSDARESVGFSRNQLGEYETKGRRTAHEAMLVQQGSGQRMSRRQKVIADLYEDLTNKLNAVIFKYWSSPRWVELTMPGSEPKWVQAVMSELKSKYRYDVEFGDDRNTRFQKAVTLFQLLSQDPSIDPSRMVDLIVSALNDPEVSRVVSEGRRDAALRLQMQEVPGGNRGVSQNQGQKQREQVSSVQRQDQKG